jgi:hypothetical protein
VQTWGVLQKAIWLLAVIKGTTGTNEVSCPQLIATFNHLYKPAGRLHPPHVGRELARAKVHKILPRSVKTRGSGI